MSERMIMSINRLNGDNYHDWKFAASMALQAKGCWDVISGVTKKPSDPAEEKEWSKKAEDGLTVIALTVQPDQYIYLRDCTDGVDAWNRLKEAYEKNSRATRITLKRQFYGFEHDVSAPMQSYVNGITELAGKLKAIGITLTDEDITDVLIFNLNNEYSSIAASLTSAKGELKIADVTSTLLEEEQRRGGPPVTENGVALMGKQRHPYEMYGPPGRRGPNRDSRDDNRPGQICYRCRKYGHIAKNCRELVDAYGRDIRSDRGGEHDKSSIAYEINESLNDVMY